MPHPVRVLPVIHILDEEQASRNLEVALEAGADGVFLINQDIGAAELIYVLRHVRGRYPDAWIGVNYLGFGFSLAFSQAARKGANALWRDSCPRERNTFGTPSKLASSFPVYVGAAFKYQPEQTLEDAIASVLKIMEPGDVAVTSGPETGAPPTVEKVETLRGLLPDQFPLAIASGLTPENVASFRPHASVFMVATDISEDFHNLDPAKTRAFVEAAHEGAD